MSCITLLVQKIKSFEYFLLDDIFDPCDSIKNSYKTQKCIYGVLFWHQTKTTKYKNGRKGGFKNM